MLPQIRVLHLLYKKRIIVAISRSIFILIPFMIKSCSLGNHSHKQITDFLRN